MPPSNTITVVRQTKNDTIDSSAIPNFTIKELRDVIPDHCFERSMVRSFGYVAWDLLLIGILFYCATWIDTLPTPLSLIAWPVYWFVQGAVGTGLWVLAHECGHQAFSNYEIVNNTVGWILHSFLLVPYHSWRISHGLHHISTGHMDRDQVYVPKTRSEKIKLAAATLSFHAHSESPLINVIKVIFMTIVGWPAYLIVNASGQNYGRRTNHFEPSSPIFKKDQATDVIISDIGLFGMLGVLAYATVVYGPLDVFRYYFVPYLWVNFWLIVITYLQHTDLKIPHYRDQEWNFVRGALATVDRDYGILNYVFHHISDTHVAHHLFSRMPHYHAEEATEALKKKLGKFYHEDNTPVFKALYNSFTTCHYVDDEGQILYYRTYLGDKTQ